MRFSRLLLAVITLSAFTAPLEAQRRGSRAPSGAGHVRGYTRRDGTHVHPYTRSTPRTYATPSRPNRPRSYSAPRAQRAPTARSYRAPSARSYPRASPNSRGRIPRSREAKDQFMRRSGYPRGRPGYVVDHVVPLCAGGADAPSNMQWQTVEEGKVKDRQERAMCARHRR